MSRNKMIAFILLSTVLVSGKSYAQEISTILGKVTKMDLESGVVSVASGSIAKQAFSDAHLDADALWEELINDGYIDSDGKIQTKFYALDKFPQMALPKKFNSKKKLIYETFKQVLANNGAMLFYVNNDSDLLRGTHHISSVEIEQGDPVTVKYDSSTDKNTVIRLIDNKAEDQ